MSLIKLDHISKTYVLGDGDVEVPALQGVDLTVNTGEYAAIMGASGSGKSTLLNILGCLDRPTGGQYFLDSQNVATLDDNRLSRIRCRQLGFIFQSYNLIPQLSVVENIEVPLFYQGQSERRCRERAVALAERVGLSQRLFHKPNQLSGGQQQRVAIARALCNDPLVILADEPTGNLDSATGKEILALLDELNRAGTTLLMVTHDDHVAQRARRVIRLRDGRIASDHFN